MFTSFWTLYYLTQNGCLFSCDADQHGDLIEIPKQLELPEGEVPVQLIANNSPQAVFCITQKGHLFGWGENKTGELGLGHAKPQKKPTQIRLPNNGLVAQIALNSWDILCVTRNNRVFFWQVSSIVLGMPGSKEFTEHVKNNTPITIPFFEKFAHCLKQLRYPAKKIDSKPMQFFNPTLEREHEELKIDKEGSYRIS